MDNNKKGIIAIVILGIALIITLSFGVIKDKQLNKKNETDYNNWTDTKTSNNSDTTDFEEKIEGTTISDANSNTNVQKKSFYEKLKGKENVRILILGDGIALSEGRDSDNGIWDQGLAYFIQNTYGSKAELISLAQKKSTVKEGLSVTSNNDISNYDLIITCFGYNDNSSKVKIETFTENYNNLIKAIKEKNNNGTIIALLPSTLSKENSYRAAIQKLATDNNFVCADTRQTFDKSGILEGKLLNSGLPNDTGYQLYTQTFEAIIKEAVSK